MTLDPLIILGGKVEEGDARRIYARRVLLMHIFISVVSVIALLGLAAAVRSFGGSVYGGALLLAALPLFFLNLRFFVRCFHMRGDFKAAFVNDVSVLVILGIILGVLIVADRLGAVVVFVALSAAEALAVVSELLRSRRSLRGQFRLLASEIRMLRNIRRWPEARRH